MKGKGCWILKNRLLLFIICAVCVFLPFCADVFAKDVSDPSLTIHYGAGKTEFSLYRVADFSETGIFKVVEPFDKYADTIKGLKTMEEHDSDDWRNLAVTLESLVTEKGIRAAEKKFTDEKGNVEWKDISKGLYLLLAKQTKDSKYIYTPSPILVTVPNRDASDKWNCQVEIAHNKLKKDEIEKKVTLEAVKIWKDSGNKDKRPASIEVNLYKNGKLYDTAVLKEKNNWKYQWNDLSAKYKWTLAEKNVPSQYEVEYSSEGDTIYVINEYKTPEKHKKPEKVQSSKNDKEITQAGQLWWPVPILCMLGMACILIGIIKRGLE